MITKGKRSVRPRVPQGKKLLQIPLSEDLHRRFKVFAANHGQTMIALVEDFVKQVVKSGSKGGRG